jgi:cell division protein FtsL
MIRLNLVLVLAVLISAVYLVSVQYDSRRLFAELDKARSDAHRLDVEYERLQVQKRAQATSARVERLAKEKLQMRQATPGITMYVTYVGRPAGNVATMPLPNNHNTVDATRATP